MCPGADLSPPLLTVPTTEIRFGALSPYSTSVLGCLNSVVSEIKRSRHLRSAPGYLARFFPGSVSYRAPRLHRRSLIKARPIAQT